MFGSLDSVQYNVSRIGGGLNTMVLAGMEGEGLFSVNMVGAGRVWLYTISLFELAAKLVRR
jgi:uncharacterized protein (AIM24 family)